MKTIYLGRPGMGGQPPAATANWRIVVWSGRYESMSPADLVAGINEAVLTITDDGVPLETVKVSMECEVEEDYDGHRATPSIEVTGQRPATRSEVVQEQDRIAGLREAHKQAEIARLKRNLADLEGR